MTLFAAGIGASVYFTKSIPTQIEQEWSQWISRIDVQNLGVNSPDWYFLSYDRGTYGKAFSRQIYEADGHGRGWRVLGGLIDVLDYGSVHYNLYIRENARYDFPPLAWDNHISRSRSYFSIVVTKETAATPLPELVLNKDLRSYDIVWIEKPKQWKDSDTRYEAQLWADLECTMGTVRVVVLGTRKSQSQDLALPCEH